MQIVIDISDKAYDYAKTQMALFLDVNKEILDAVKNGTVVSERPKGDIMDFPNTFEEYAKRYSFKDVEEHYTNGSELIPVFRINQWLEHAAYKLAKKTMPEVIDTLLESIKEEFSPIVGEYTTQEVWEIIDKHKIRG